MFKKFKKRSEEHEVVDKVLDEHERELKDNTKRLRAIEMELGIFRPLKSVKHS